jgi:hypothetical protein
MKILKRYKTGCVKLELDGVTLGLSRSGSQLRVSGCDDWEALPGLVQAGKLVRTYDQHCFNHIEYYAAPDLWRAIQSENAT